MRADEMRALVNAVHAGHSAYMSCDPTYDERRPGAYKAMHAAVDALRDVSSAYSIGSALDDERRQTQRRVIAALYWRAGWAKDAAERERPSSQHRTALMRRYLSAREMASDMQIAMEAAL